MNPSDSNGHARVDEPAGLRTLAAPLSLGGPGARVIIPGVADGAAAEFVYQQGAWMLRLAPRLGARLNAQPAQGEIALRAGDVLALGEARVFVRDVAHGLELDVRHLAGNDTLAPLVVPRQDVELLDEQDAEVIAADIGDAAGRLAAAKAREAEPARRTRWWPWLTAAALALVSVFALLGRLERVTLELDPADARVRANAILSWHSGNTLFVMPGRHRLRADAPGYMTVQRSVEVARGAGARVVMRLPRRGGVLVIDTGGVAAQVFADGAALGRAPGELALAAGKHTLRFTAERYVDAVMDVEVEGLGKRQPLKVALRSAWGKLAVSSATAGATGRVAGDSLALPGEIALPAGVHSLEVSAPAARVWRSSVLIKPGQTTTVGPIQLGAPDARLTVRSAPAGAAVTIAGEFRGRTPLDVELPPGARYEVLLSLMGYAPWSRTVAAEPGIRTALEARLEPVYVSLTLQGEPADAELLIDGQPRGAAAATHQVLAGQRRIEVRRAGMQTFANNVDLAAGLARVLEYRLVPEGRPADWKPPAAAAVTKVGQSLRLMPAGVFTMGSARREQGRRPNEVLRSVTLSRPVYLGVREVTNAEFRRFRAEHSSGSTGQRSIDLDNHPVSMVTWNDAVEYCNWLSQQEGLPPAYEQKEGRWTLRVPVTTGYRLPTEAEWEFAARHAPNGLRRYEWGDALPPPAAAGNLAGQEAETTLEAWLRDYRDDYPVVAPVGKYPPNALGLQDMTGNVSEWVHDFYSSFGDAAASTDPLGPPSGTRHVVRGASWRTAAYADLRLAWREGAEAAGQDIGFRLARYAE